MFGGRGGGSLEYPSIIWHNIPDIWLIYLLGFRGLNYLKLFKIIMGGIKTFIGEGPIRGRVI